MDSVDSEIVDQLAASTQEPDRIRTFRLFRKIHSLLLLRIVSFAVMECYAIYDESISAFFSGSGGGVVIVMIWLLQLILSGYTSLSSRLGPDKPSNRNRFITLSVMECTIYSGMASNLYHSNHIRLTDVLLLNGSISIYHSGHVFFFFNPWFGYHGLYGICFSALCVASPLAAFHLSLSFNNATSGDTSTYDDLSTAVDWQSSVEIVCVCCLLVCFWYSLETHVVVRKRHRFRLEQHEDYFYVMLCFAYADVWNVVAKCNFFVTKSSETVVARAAAEGPTTCRLNCCSFLPHRAKARCENS